MRFAAPEGATPIEDAEGLLQEGLFTQADLSAAEAENILQAVNKHPARPRKPGSAWMTDAFIRRVHRDMFGNVWSWAGRYRTAPLNLVDQPV